MFLATAAREQIDIGVADFSNYGGVRYGLVAIDDFSKKLCVVPMVYGSHPSPSPQNG